MAIKIDIRADVPFKAEADVTDIINKVGNECTLGYDGLYAGVHLTGDIQIQEMNRKFRNIDKATDVLSFPLLIAENGTLEFSDLDRDMETGLIMMGDIVVSVEKTMAQAEEYGHSYEREIAFLTCHGMLHLMGYDHENKEDEGLMLSKQKSVLNKLGYLK